MNLNDVFHSYIDTPYINNNNIDAEP